MLLPAPSAEPRQRNRAQGVSVVLGPTNTGKTHYAIERMLSYPTGMIGLPLRLLAREVYNRAIAKVGTEAVALVTGEEKIKPKAPRYWISTLEAMPRDIAVDFVAVDEIQLAADLDRGYIFTDRLLHRRGREETLLIGAATMRRAVLGLVPDARIVERPRLSKLSFAGDRKIARLPRRSAIVGFSAEDVYAIAEWIRRQRGGAAVVLGALSPRTRNAQVEMFQNGDVDYIVATDAIGMGLNLDVDHIAFAADRKFDGWQYRRLAPAELGQIAGRAGRHLKDGTFGTTGRCAPFDAELVEALEDHRFDAVSLLQWRNTDLDFSSLADLAASLDVVPKEPGLTRAPLAEDQMVLDIVARDATVVRATRTRADLSRLWDCCQIPDYRKVSPGAHAELVLSVFGFVVRAGHIPDDWFARHIAALDRIDGDIDTLSARIAQVRTWTFIANRPDWMGDPEHWQGVARQVEDSLSDALHERLAQRFVDRRTSVLMRRLREKVMLEAEVTPSGDVMVEGQHVGQLNGFRFTPDPQAAGEAAKALNAAAMKALAGEIEGRATRINEAVDEAFVLANDGTLRWLGEPVGKIAAGAHVLEPVACVLADEQLSGALLERVQRRLGLWLVQHVKKLLGPLVELEKAEGLEGIARGIAFQVAEALGVLDRARVADEVKTLSQEARSGLRKLGVRFGAYHLYLPSLVKPAPRALAAQLWSLTNGGVDEVKGLDDVPHLAASGRTSFAADKEVPEGLYRAAGFRVCGERTVRVDILERLADLVRPAVTYRPGVTPGPPPPGAADGDGFIVTVAMTSLAGCAGESFASILRALGYMPVQRKGPAITVPLLAEAPTVPLEVSEPETPHRASAAEEGLGEPASSDPVARLEPAALAGDMPQHAGSEEPTDAAVSAGPAVPEAAVEEHAPPPEAPVATAEVPDVTAAAETAEEALIEVWKPQRHHYQGRRPIEARVRRRPPDQKRPAGPAGGEAASLPQCAEPQAAASEAASRGRDSMPSGEGRRSRGRGQAGDEHVRPREKTGSATGDARSRQDAPRDRHNGRGAASRALDESSQASFRQAGKSPRKTQDRPPDPNSPFAKLLVLKARLEEKDKQNQ
jgi:ATP-dependent RNA helicase SUPV3L1/SUV3